MKKIIFILLMVLLAGTVNAFTCYNGAEPIRFNDYICVSDTKQSHACQGGGYACEVGYNYLKQEYGYVYYCDYSTSFGFVECEDGCDQSTGLCKEGYQSCSNGMQACCNSKEDCVDGTYRSTGDAYQCVNSDWVLKQECSAEQSCEESGGYLAQCNANTIWYCFTDEQKICYESSVKTSNCWSNFEECEVEAQRAGTDPPEKDYTFLIIGGAIIGLLIIGRKYIPMYLKAGANSYVIIAVIILIMYILLRADISAIIETMSIWDKIKFW
jgi:hypothetical protein